MDFTKASQMDILTDGNSILNNHDQQSLGLAYSLNMYTW